MVTKKYGGFWGALMLVAFLPFMVFMGVGGDYLTFGNFHDVFIPYLSVVAIEHGLVLHRDFHSPFGWVYFYLNDLAFLLIRRGFFSFNDLIPLGSLIWAIFVVGLCFFYDLIQTPAAAMRRVPLFVLGVFLVLIVFNFRGGARVGLLDSTWYGVYNNHMWGIAFLQLATLIRSRSVFQEQPRRMALFQSALTYVCLHYKFNFGIGSAFLAVVPVFFDWGRLGYWLYLRWVFASILLAIGVTALLGYDYVAYASDLVSAAVAKSENREGVDINAAYCAMLLMLIGALCIIREGLALRYIGQCALCCLAFYFFVVGDYAVPLLNYVAACGVVAVCSFNGWGRSWLTRLVAIFGVSGMIFLVGVNYASVVYLCAAKMGWVQPEGVERFLLKTPFGELVWRGDFSRLFRPGLLSERVGHYSLDIQRVLWAYPNIADLRRRSVSVANFDYIEGLKLVQARYSRSSSAGARGVVYLEFVDPLPVLVDGVHLESGVHWIHFGTTIAYSSDMPDMQRRLASSDEVVIPLASVDNWRQSLLNCKFLLWNDSKGWGYELSETDGYHLYYRKSSSSILTLPHTLEKRVRDNCRGVVAAARAGELTSPAF